MRKSLADAVDEVVLLKEKQETEISKEMQKSPRSQSVQTEVSEEEVNLQLGPIRYVISSLVRYAVRYVTNRLSDFISSTHPTSDEVGW